MCKCLRGFLGLHQDNQAPASHSLLCNISVGRYRGERGESFCLNYLWAGQMECLLFKSLLFMYMVRLALFQSFPLKHAEEKIELFSTVKLVIIKMAYTSMGMNSFLLRQQRQNWTLIRLCSTTLKGTTVSRKTQSHYAHPRKWNGPGLTLFPWDEVMWYR